MPIFPKKLFFTVITVTDELNAYRVFETLNARGVRLSSTDLLKNYLFSVLYRQQNASHELKVLENRWEAMVGRLGGESFPDFLRVHWNSGHRFVRQAELFKTIRNSVSSREQVFALAALPSPVSSPKRIPPGPPSALPNGKAGWPGRPQPSGVSDS